MDYLDRAGSHFNDMNQLSGQQAAQAEAFLGEKGGGGGGAAGGLCFCRIASLKRFEADDERYSRSISGFYSIAAKLGATVVFLWQAHRGNVLTCDIGADASLAHELTRSLADQVRGLTYTSSQPPQIDPSYEVWGMDGLCCSAGGKSIPRIDEVLAGLKPGCALMLVLNPISDTAVKEAVARVDKHASFLSLFQRLSATVGITRSKSQANGTSNATANTRIETDMSSTSNSDAYSRQAGSVRGSNSGVHSFLSVGSNNGTNQGAGVTHTTGTTQGTNTGTTIGHTNTSSDTQTVGESDTDQMNVTSTFSRISSALQQLLRRRSRLHRGRTTGMTRCAIYALAPAQKARIILAMVNAQARTEAVNGDVNDDVFSSIRHVGTSEVMARLLQTGIHPQGFGTAALPGEILPFLPMREMRGFQLDYAASYARNIIQQSPSADTIRIGSIIDEEKVTDRAAELNIDDFTSHILAVGSTGCGKTTTLTNLCNQTMLKRPHVHVLAIDPKDSIRCEDYVGGATLYTTRTDTNTNILRLQPFAVPPGVALAAHIDKLQSLFQSCWPMSAAMPDILKQAVFNTYRRCGWDVARSIRLNIPGVPYWPNFRMLEEETRRIIDEGKFSPRTRSDYIGALCTRLHSLSNNACAQIFRTEDAIPLPQLFDRSVIVHCGSISGETLSLVMSILLMQLVEYRQSIAGGERNRPLQHITLFEEAHALAPRSTPPSDNTESVSIGSKTSETIVKLLAEARDMGECIVLSNQTVHEISEQAVENTTTKLIFHIQGKGDIQTIAAALSLDSTPVNGVSQAFSLARLDPYQAIVYQRSWLSMPVKIRMDNNALASNEAQRNAFTMDERRRWVGEVLQVLTCAPSLEAIQEQMHALLADSRIAEQLRHDTRMRLEACLRAEGEQREVMAGRLLLSFFDGLTEVLLPHFSGNPDALVKGVMENLVKYADVSRLPQEVQEHIAREILKAERDRGTPGV